MQRIFYSGSSIVTSDDIASAVLDYAEALAKDDRAAIIHLPVLLDPSGEGVASMLVGPSSQLVTVTEPSDRPEPTDAAFITDITEKTKLLGQPRPTATPDAGRATEGLADYEF